MIIGDALWALLEQPWRLCSPISPQIPNHAFGQANLRVYELGCFDVSNKLAWSASSDAYQMPMLISGANPSFGYGTAPTRQTDLYGQCVVADSSNSIRCLSALNGGASVFGDTRAYRSRNTWFVPFYAEAPPAVTLSTN